MRRFILSILVLFPLINAIAQKNRLQELKEQLANHWQRDTFRVNRLNKLADLPDFSAPGRAAAADEALSLSRQLNFREGEAHALIAQAQTKDKVQAIHLVKQAVAVAEKSGNKILISEASSALGYMLAGTEQKELAVHYLLTGVAVAQAANNKSRLAYAQAGLSEYYLVFNSDIIKALDWSLKALHTAEQSNDNNALFTVCSQMATVYGSLGDNATALTYLEKALEANRKIGDTYMGAILLNNKGELYRLSAKYPLALAAYQAALLTAGDDPYVKELEESNEANVYERMGDYPAAKQYAFSALNLNKKSKRLDLMSWAYNTLANVSLHTGKPDSALYYGKLGYDAAVKIGYLEMKRDNSQVLANAYAQKKIFDKAYTFQLLYVSYRDSILNTDIKNEASLLRFNADLQKKQAEIAVLNKDKQLQKAEAQRQYYLLIGALAALLLIAALMLVLYRNNRNKQKANSLLQKQNLEIQNQRDQIRQALAELQATQRQLVQSEKMASLGELTAGIAHEIQNPLNFVNNFSEVSSELLQELKDERSKMNGLRNEQMEVEIMEDISQNLQKISHHGKRADAIVKGMLEHSRTNTGKKEPTNINALADDYLRLAYHGFKAKDKDFNAGIQTEFDESIDKIEVVPQDIGRVLQNLFNNAFYSVNEKKRATNGENYQPAVWLTTKRIDTPSGRGGLEVSVKDNGNGIPQKVVDKIFQPFFTTKPTGQGTGLGLSLSYDIIKAHSAEIKVESREGEGATFIVSFAFNSAGVS